nr:GHKL domain-containing protein [Clostridia bacterium]
ACGKLSPDARFIDLVLRTEGESVLYIVATNSFDGKVRKNGDTYLSTAKHHSGIGLRSIRETAAKYGGSARFTNTGKEFNIDVILPLQ